MADPGLCLVRAPGVGVAFLDQSTGAVVQAYAVPQGDEAAREVAARFCSCVLGERILDAGSTDPLDIITKVLLADWGNLGAHAHKAVAASSLVAVDRALDWTRPDFNTRRDPKSAVPCWTDIQHFLAGKKIDVRRRAASQGAKGPTSVPLDCLPVFEAVDANGKVVSEGKGDNDDKALHSVLGEAMERILAQTPDENRLIRGTRGQLQAQGFATPDLKSAYQDLYSDALPLDWVPATTMAGVRGALPAELAFYPYYPSPVRAFSIQHTAGLAAGASREEAALAALFEAIETDAYWASMRTHTVRGVFRDLVACDDPVIKSVMEALGKLGFRVHAGLINFDWPLSIVHVVLESKAGILPALSHGLGSGLIHVDGIRRALLEAVQVYTGLQKVVAEYWPQVGLKQASSLEPALAWSSPAFVPRIVDMFETAPAVSHLEDEGKAVSTVEALLASMTERSVTPWIAFLGEAYGLDVARVFLEGGISAFSERDAPSDRLHTLAKGLGLTSLHFDPILT